ncbi:MAG TPA: thioredoxin domain-containing protein [Gaiellaceae bacterium]|nr:thioredoxin domain-containing protein [Gaiellaceae bacterium]
MTSGKAARRQRQAAVARPPVRSTGGRKANPWVVGGALAAIAAVIAVVVIVLAVTGGNGSSSSSATGTALPDGATIEKQFAGIPQQGNVLGKATAPATLVEYIDLQCPVCRDFETSVMPTLINRYVRTGKLKVIARPVTVIGPDSERGRRAMIAAFAQNRGFNFSQLLYFNQGPENGGWLDDSMVADAATSIPGVDVKQLQDAMNTKAVSNQASQFDRQAQADQLAGTPTILVGKTGGRLTNLGAGVPSIGTLSTLINNAQ